MSFRAKLLSEGMRRFGPTHTRGEPTDVVALRAFLEASTKYMPRPKEVHFEPTEISGVCAEWVSLPGADEGRVVLYLHGGSYIAGSPRTHRNLTFRIARAARARVLVLDYRLAPEHPFPAAVEDVLSAQRGLSSDTQLRLAWCGDSAGGGLMFAALRAASREGVPLPCAMAALSPWTDLACAGASFGTNEAHESMLSMAQLRGASAMYCAGRAPDDPAISAAYGSFEAAPPCLVQVGQREILLDDARAVVARLGASGFAAELEVWPDVPHVWHMFAPLLPEARQAINRVGSFLSRHLER
jgi:acetyl esterase/lipase